MSSDNPPDADQAMPRRPRIKSLDGVRAFAIVLVLISHGTHHEGVRLPVIEGTTLGLLVRGCGGTGVQLFFVLSGYLITHLLIAEHRRNGHISLRRFWFRRALRIFPVLYVFLACVAVAAYFGVFHIEWEVFAYTGTYLWNYRGLFGPLDYEGHMELGHLWSLAVEEQFYVFYPLLFLQRSLRRIFATICLLVIATPLLRVGHYYLLPDLRHSIVVMGHTAFGCTIAVGCAWSLAEGLGLLSATRERVTGAVGFWAAACIGCFVSPLLSVLYEGVWTVPIGHTVNGVCYMIMIAHVVRFADTTSLGRFLNCGAMVWLGAISYSLYVWHQPLFQLDVPGVPILASRALLVAAAIVVAAASYHGLEKPILDRREALWRWLGKARSITGFERVA